MTEYVWINIEARSRINCCRTSARTITYSECLFVTYVIHHAKRKPLIILSSVASPVPRYFSTLFRNNIRMDLQKVGCGYMDWIGLAQDRDRWRTLVSAVMNFGVP